MTCRPCPTLAALPLPLLLLLTLPPPARGQLLSPGRLAEAHAELAGIRNCTSCHRLGTAGISAELCLDCHEPLSVRMLSDLGYHATLDGRDCADCHQDHLGEGFDLVRLDESTFPHWATGYRLEASHVSVACRDCHRSENIVADDVVAWMAIRDGLDRTYLGLSADCVGCHAPDDPHGDQFAGRGCADCHDEGAWVEPARFEHVAAAFPLLGEHADVDCAGCHVTEGEGTRWRPVVHGACADCHAPSPHGDAMSGECASCHSVEGWHVLSASAVADGFDHDRTEFPLGGAHAAADCAGCHGPRAGSGDELLHITFRPGSRGSEYPRPVADGCASCHAHRHALSAAQGSWSGCADCHAEEAWAPTSFGLEQHGKTAFPLSGAHSATPCFACHVDDGTHDPPFLLALDGRRCADCHLAGTEHRPGYDVAECEACHVTEAFDVVAFDHEQAASACVSCHAPDDPHDRQFPGVSCATCHETKTFSVSGFDHSATRFPLDGAHRLTACSDCHRAEPGTRGPVVRYRPLGTACVDCHGHEA